MVSVKSELMRLRLVARTAGPNKNFDFGSDFFLIAMAELLFNKSVLLSAVAILKLERINKVFTISPLREYLYLKPLYSSLGGSTTLQLPFKKKPIVAFFLLKPLYRWKIFTHLALVLSAKYTHDSFCNN